MTLYNEILSNLRQICVNGPHLAVGMVSPSGRKFWMFGEQHTKDSESLPPMCKPWELLLSEFASPSRWILWEAASGPGEPIFFDAPPHIKEMFMTNIPIQFQDLYISDEKEYEDNGELKPSEDFKEDLQDPDFIEFFMENSPNHEYLSMNMIELLWIKTKEESRL